MNINEFDYILDKKLIAQFPSGDRTQSRMMILSRLNNEIIHSHFHTITEFIDSSYVMVLNDTKVFPARLYALNEEKKIIELLLVKELSEGVWEVLAKPKKTLQKSKILYFSDGIHTAYLLDAYTARPVIQFTPNNDIVEFVEQYGKPPLPPYIKRAPDEFDENDINRYQTVYAKNKGSIAAPTAGFHFTPEILQALKDKGVQIVYITLHVGPGTFQTIRVSTLEDHTMEPEYYEISPEAFRTIKKAKDAGKKILAVGTTSTRTLEAVNFSYNIDKPLRNWTNLFIYPGYQFKMVDALLTNFHLPKSTLLLLACAFATKEKIYRAYQEAIAANYRFFSYGDCMLIK